jgi:hypothetical protein
MNLLQAAVFLIWGGGGVSPMGYLRTAVFHEEHCYCFTVHGTGRLACFDSESTFETTNPFRHSGRNPCTGDRPIARRLPTQNTTQKNSDTYRCPERDTSP